MALLRRTSSDTQFKEHIEEQSIIYAISLMMLKRLTPLDLHGGSDIRLLRNTEKILEWASSARDTYVGKDTTTNDLAFIRRQIIRILYYLDGISSRPSKMYQ